jgi:hypothetical protein
MPEAKEPMMEATCEECGVTDTTVHPHFLLYGFMLCQSCSISKTLFPV